MKSGRRFRSRLIGLALMLAFCWSGYYLFDYAMDEYQMYKLEKQLAQDKHMVISDSKGSIDLTKLSNMNDQSVGWITIAGTAIDYPVVQADNNSYYLTHDFNNDPSIQGSIFMDYRNESNMENAHTIMYGHNMKNGTMFHDLNNYQKEGYLNDHSYIDYYGPNAFYRWEIFSTYSTDVSFDYLQTGFGTGEEYISFINQLKSRSDFSYSGKPFSEEERILTLSTCSKDLKDGRRVVHARLIEEIAYAN